MEWFKFIIIIVIEPNPSMGQPQLCKQGVNAISGPGDSHSSKLYGNYSQYSGTAGSLVDISDWPRYTRWQTKLVKCVHLQSKSLKSSRLKSQCRVWEIFENFCNICNNIYLNKFSNLVVNTLCDYNSVTETAFSMTIIFVWLLSLLCLV